jgi:Xaa-Pro aminopeptidase
MNFILRNENATRYECGYGCDNGVYLSLGSEAWFITDGRYSTEAREATHGAKVLISADPVKKAAQVLRKNKIKKCLFDPKEWDIFAFRKLDTGEKRRWKESPGFSHRRRIIKSRDEITLLKKAARIGAEAFDVAAAVFSDRGIGTDERRLTFLAESILKDYGKRQLSFDPIVALNDNAAKPHSRPGKKKMKNGDLLLMDAGVRYRGYCSDRTRTVSVAKGFDFGYDQYFGSRSIQRAYDTVLRAHDRAISKARSGMRASEIDALARDVIEKAGYGKYFVHSTGHGVGLDIHEMPYISAKNRERISDGMVFTIEPGIYIPGKFGIRIEDMVAMIRGRAEVL